MRLTVMRPVQAAWAGESPSGWLSIGEEHGLPLPTERGHASVCRQAKEVLGKGALMFVAKAPGSSQFQVGMMEGTYATQALSTSGPQRPLIGVGESKAASILLHPLSHNYDRPTLAIGQPPGLIVLLELKLKAAPA